jgi:hypothetical protein
MERLRLEGNLRRWQSSGHYARHVSRRFAGGPSQRTTLAPMERDLLVARLIEAEHRRVHAVASLARTCALARTERSRSMIPKETS